jgi:uncharacterized protein YciI
VSYFVVTLTYNGQPSPELIAAQQERLASMTSDGTLMWSGPFADGRGGMAILDVESEDDARAIYQGTPLATAGAITWDLRAWNGRAGTVAALLKG